jgi:hypothetical protein
MTTVRELEEAGFGLQYSVDSGNGSGLDLEGAKEVEEVVGLDEKVETSPSQHSATFKRRS